MNNPHVPVLIQILGKDYHISCPEDEQENLLVASRFLDGKMREVRDSGKVIGMERIAVMAALNIVHEFRLLKQRADELSRQLDDCHSRLQQNTDSWR